MRVNTRNLSHLYSLIIENLFKPELIVTYNEVYVNEFIKNSYEAFDKSTQKKEIALTYRKMNINIEKLIKKDENVSSDSDN